MHIKIEISMRRKAKRIIQSFKIILKKNQDFKILIL